MPPPCLVIGDKSKNTSKNHPRTIQDTMNSMIDFRNAPFSFYVIRPPVQTYATKAHHAITAWASEQRAKVDRILSRPTPSDNVLIQGEAQRVAEIELVLDDHEDEANEHVSWIASVTWLFN
jgi:alpha/beta superfamily hydrolase